MRTGLYSNNSTRSANIHTIYVSDRKTNTITAKAFLSKKSYSQIADLSHSTNVHKVWRTVQEMRGDKKLMRVCAVKLQTMVWDISH